MDVEVGDHLNPERDEMREALKGYKVQNLTIMETLDSRNTRSVLLGLSRIYARYRSLGVPLYRLHTDRAKEFIARPVQQWCATHQLIQTMTGGDDPASNGRIESEVNQLKRRLRVIMASSGAPADLWPAAARQAVLERMNRQMKVLGLNSVPEVPFYSKILVRAKRWHRAGALESPYLEVRSLGPSPMMSWGWVVETEDGKIQHSRIAVQYDPLAEQAAYELSFEPIPGAPRTRVTGKQPLHAGPRFGGAVADDAEPALHALRAGGEPVVPATASDAAWKGGNLHGAVMDYQQHLEDRHWGLKMLIKQELDIVPGDGLEGEVQGQVIEMASEEVKALEDELQNLKSEALQLERERCFMKAVTPDTDEAPKVLQTYTVPLNEVKANLADWLPSMRDEYEALTSKMKAVIKWTEAEAKKLPGYDSAEFAPCKVVNTIKAPNGRHRSRIVICGNMVEDMHSGEPSRGADKQELYAGGVDGVSARCVFKKAAHCQWEIATVDVKCAFLLAPRQCSKRLLLTRPPRVFVDAGICQKDEVWEVSTALYGLETSPADWSLYRDSIISKLKWEQDGRECRLQRTTEQNLWKLCSRPLGKTEADETEDGFVIVYVDDILATAPHDRLEGLFARIREEWTTSDPEWVSTKGWVKFLGYELKWKVREDGLRDLMVAQPSYVRELLNRHQVSTVRTMPPGRIELEDEEDLSPAHIKEAQAYVGELLWLSIRTRPDLSFTVAVMAQHISKAPRQVAALGKEVMSYLNGTTMLGLHYGPCSGDRGLDDVLPLPRNMKLIEMYSDISYAPGGRKSHQSTLAYYGGSLVQWESCRQPFSTLSTAESELIGYVDAMTMGESLSAVLGALEEDAWNTGAGEKLIYGDNTSALAIVKSPDGPWRTRHLRLRANVLRERVKCGAWDVRHLPGKDLVADTLTKAIQSKQHWTRFFQQAGMRDCDDLGADGMSQDERPVDVADVDRTTCLTKLGLGIGVLGSALGAVARWSPQEAFKRKTKVACLAALSVGLASLGGHWALQKIKWNEASKNEKTPKKNEDEGASKNEKTPKKNEEGGASSGSRSRTSEPDLRLHENGLNGMNRDHAARMDAPWTQVGSRALDRR